MAIYEYYCPTCRDRFERRRPMSEAAEETTCGRGHRAARTISAFAMAKVGGDSVAALGSTPAAGGCCGGGGCGCGRN
ncbi:MAG: zinc ribbon domain-containing protein [Dehalococcoidia bacterium]|nr:zinc ribbon domain-containing protein [Dehalococcoidia bacterium]